MRGAAELEVVFEQRRTGVGSRIGHLDDLVDDLEQEAGLGSRPADAFDAGGMRRARAVVARVPGACERHAGRFGHAQPRAEAAVEIGRAHVCTAVTNAHPECRHLLEKKTTICLTMYTIK